MPRGIISIMNVTEAAITSLVAFLFKIGKDRRELSPLYACENNPQYNIILQAQM